MKNFSRCETGDFSIFWTFRNFVKDKCNLRFFLTYSDRKVQTPVFRKVHIVIQSTTGPRYCWSVIFIICLFSERAVLFPVSLLPRYPPSKLFLVPTDNTHYITYSVLQQSSKTTFNFALVACIALSTSAEAMFSLRRYESVASTGIR